jgi:hypothetical protein
MLIGNKKNNVRNIFRTTMLQLGSGSERNVVDSVDIKLSRI